MGGGTIRAANRRYTVGGHSPPHIRGGGLLRLRRKHSAGEAIEAKMSHSLHFRVTFESGARVKKGGESLYFPLPSEHRRTLTRGTQGHSIIPRLGRIGRSPDQLISSIGSRTCMLNELPPRNFPSRLCCDVTTGSDGSAVHCACAGARLVVMVAEGGRCKQFFPLLACLDGLREVAKW